jgi:hypothetical protein
MDAASGGLRTDVLVPPYLRGEHAERRVMSFTKKALAATVLFAAVVFVAAAAADHGHRGHGHKTLLRQHLVGSILSDQPIHTVVRGGVPWQGGGDAKLDRRGRFEARIRA